MSAEQLQAIAIPAEAMDIAIHVPLEMPGIILELGEGDIERMRQIRNAILDERQRRKVVAKRDEMTEMVDDLPPSESSWVM